jgi:hypothetical protein
MDAVLEKGYQATTAITQFAAVVLTSDTQIKQCDGANQFADGICLEHVAAADATNGRVVAVRVMGRVRAINGTAGALARKTRVAVDNQGRVVAATTGQNQIGYTLTAAAAQGDIVELQLTPGATAP